MGEIKAMSKHIHIMHNKKPLHVLTHVLRTLLVHALFVKYATLLPIDLLYL